MWPNPSVDPAGPVRLEQLHWIIGQANLRYLQAAGPDLVPRLLAGPETIVVRESPTSRIPDRRVPMDLFASYDELARLIRLDAITPGVRAVAYDPKSWAANPSVVVIATLSTAPGRVLADPGAIAGAARTMLPYVQGFMLNLTEATTPAAAAFLRALSSGSD